MFKRFCYFISLCLLITLFFFSCNSSNPPITQSDIFIVHYINVSQGDAILIQVNNKNLLIDSGSKSEQTKIIKYLDQYKINTLDYVIATHPHEDHIGNMKKIIKTYKINNFYAPKITSSSKSFNDMIDSLYQKNLKINVITPFTTSIDLGDNTTVQIFSPQNRIYEDLNNYSPIIKISYKNTSFLFTGDAEKEAESEVLENEFNVTSDVIKIGHHGSSSSTSIDFLSKVNPTIAVIMCGEDNDFGHPHAETLNKLSIKNIVTYRTDKDGNIILISNGTQIKKY